LLIDSHCHLDHEAFASDRAAVLERSRTAGVDAWVVPAYSPRNWSRLQDLAESAAGVAAAYGVHPLYLGELSEQDWGRLPTLLAKAVALGEIGLDRGEDAPPLELQLTVLGRQLDLAQELELPVILHARRASEDLLQALRAWAPLRGVWHSFSGSWEQARKALDLGLHLGVGGTVTHPRAARLRRVLQALPLEALVLETDAPFQPPAAHPQQRNEPAYLREILAAVAELLAIAPEKLAEITVKNTLIAFPRLERELCWTKP